eukprot:CAMPEP_0197244614 /NCGR_PEP_ID=MMETSP1429-20130617/9687_1 /TAXON_ID=49237 /ORGANISM="Chaetoceros  sp., Strain UNC1202" /LENGTH=231 /DNA_ID=CAMNT_0042704997 /DNA_START=1 /DNA_END=696 /DNA_ORIENTATION=+
MLNKNIKKLNINIDSDDEASDAQDGEVKFWKNAVDEDNNDADREDDEQQHSKPEVIKMEKYLKRAQRLLLQATVCIEEFALLKGEEDADDNVDTNNFGDHESGGEGTREDEGKNENITSDDNDSKHYDQVVENSVQEEATGMSDEKVDKIPGKPESAIEDSTGGTGGEEEGECREEETTEQIITETAVPVVGPVDPPALTDNKQIAMMKMGEDGLKETQQILERVLELWPK